MMTDDICKSYDQLVQILHLKQRPKLNWNKFAFSKKLVGSWLTKICGINVLIYYFSPISVASVHVGNGTTPDYQMIWLMEYNINCFNMTKIQWLGTSCNVATYPFKKR